MLCANPLSSGISLLAVLCELHLYSVCPRPSAQNCEKSIVQDFPACELFFKASYYNALIKVDFRYQIIYPVVFLFLTSQACNGV